MENLPWKMSWNFKWGLNNIMSRCLHLNAMGSFVYANGTESCTIDSLATGRPRLLEGVKRVGIWWREPPCMCGNNGMVTSPLIVTMCSAWKSGRWHFTCWESSKCELPNEWWQRHKPLKMEQAWSSYLCAVGDDDDVEWNLSYPYTGLDKPFGVHEFYEGGKVVSPIHWPPLPPRIYPW